MDHAFHIDIRIRLCTEDLELLTLCCVANEIADQVIVSRLYKLANEECAQDMKLVYSIRI